MGQWPLNPVSNKYFIFVSLVSWLKETLKQEATAMGKEAIAEYRGFLAQEPQIPQIKHKQVATILFIFFSVGKKKKYMFLFKPRIKDFFKAKKKGSKSPNSRGKFRWPVTHVHRFKLFVLLPSGVTKTIASFHLLHKYLQKKNCNNEREMIFCSKGTITFVAVSMQFLLLIFEHSQMLIDKSFRTNNWNFLAPESVKFAWNTLQMPFSYAYYVTNHACLKKKIEIEHIFTTNFRWIRCILRATLKKGKILMLVVDENI